MLLGVAAGRARVLAALGRPLFFASVDADVARAAGVPVRALGLGFLLLLGLAVAATSQITGALLVFALLVTPAATAQQLTARPGPGSRSRSRSRSRSPGSGSRSRTSRSTRSASTSPRCPSASTCGPGSARTRARRLAARAGRAAGLMFAHEFMRNALLAGTFIALACGLVGYFVVLRAQVFAGDALSHVAFTGALAAAAAGIDIRVGLFAATHRSPGSAWARSATAPAPTTS